MTGDTEGQTDVFVRDVSAGVTTRVSVDSLGVGGSASSESPALSGDGRVVAFTSLADNLAPGGGPISFRDVFLYDRASMSLELISVGPAGVRGNRSSYALDCSLDGSVVSFRSGASNFVPGDTNGVVDIFVRDRTLGTTERVSISTTGAQAPSGVNDRGFLSDDGNLVGVNSLEEQPIGYTRALGISGDGRFILFHTYATNVGPSGRTGLFVRDRVTKLAEPASLPNISRRRVSSELSHRRHA